MVWVDERGTLLGIGVPREERERQGIIGRSLEIRDELARQTYMMEEIAETGVLERAGDEDKEKSEEPKAGAEPFWIVPVFYATDRKRNPQSSVDDVRYTNERAPNEKVSPGVCSVCIPRTHQLGQLERPTFWLGPTFMLFRYVLEFQSGDLATFPGWPSIAEAGPESRPRLRALLRGHRALTPALASRQNTSTIRGMSSLRNGY
jgi:hypothetical protein